MPRAPLPVLAEGEGWLIVGKPPQLLTHKTAMSSDRIAALQWVRDQIGTKVTPIHRLDRPASGCLLFGTDPDLSADLHGALRRSETLKLYLALVRGEISPGASTVIERPLDGKESCTEVRVLASMPEPRCSLVLCRIRTGRFHQVRRHLAGIGHPILGDSSHGDTRVNRWWRENRALPRLMLHGFRLEAELPDGPAKARCPVWPDMRALLQALPIWEQACAVEAELAEDFATPPPWPTGAPPAEGEPTPEQAG